MELLNELKNDVKAMLLHLDTIQNLSLEVLSTRVGEDSWNVLECFQHMNLYGSFYIEEIDHSVSNSKYPGSEYFKLFGLGNYSAKSMLPKKQGKVNMAMKTFPKMDPINTNLGKEVLIEFRSQMNQFLSLIERSKSVNLRKTKCRLTIKWLQFNLGDTLRFMINHNQRHMIQVDRILNSIQS